LPAAGVAVAEQIDTPTAQGSYKVHAQGLCEVVTDKGYHGGASLAAMQQWGVRTYVSVVDSAARLAAVGDQSCRTLRSRLLRLDRSPPLLLSRRNTPAASGTHRSLRFGALRVGRLRLNLVRSGECPTLLLSCCDLPSSRRTHRAFRYWSTGRASGTEAIPNCDDLLLDFSLHLLVSNECCLKQRCISSGSWSFSSCQCVGSF
jgi:hypothetical protein